MWEQQSSIRIWAGTRLHPDLGAARLGQDLPGRARILMLDCLFPENRLLPIRSDGQTSSPTKTRVREQNEIEIKLKRCGKETFTVKYFEKETFTEKCSEIETFTEKCSGHDADIESSTKYT